MVDPTIRGDGYVLAPAAFDEAEVVELRSGLEAAVGRAVALTGGVTEASTSDLGHRIQTVHDGGTPTSVHWEPGTGVPTVRNLRPVTHLDARLERYWTDPRLTGPAADLLGVDGVAPLTSKISVKRARVGSEYIWHQDHSFLSRFLGGRAASEVVTAMVFLDDADAGNGALSLVPGSHRDGPRPDDEPPRAHDADPVTMTAPAGSVVVFPTLMLHSSRANRSDRDRRALLYLFQPAGRPPLDESTRA
ncbi:MAG: phytanoyl-CoA dioxygenase family protein [Pseudonocardia sediminis]